MEAKTSKKSYYLPVKLMDFFAEWCKPGRDYSPKIAGAIFYYMTLPAGIRELCEQTAYDKNIEMAVKEMKNKLTNIDFERQFRAAFDEFVRRKERSSPALRSKSHKNNTTG